MAIFGSKKKEVSAKPVKAEKVVATKAVAVKSSGAPVNMGANAVIIRPHITEKSGLLSQNGVYTFVISRTANKDSIGKAIKNLYKVTPVKIALTNNPSKKVFVRGKVDTVSGIRKAVVTVKKGEKIDFV